MPITSTLAVTKVTAVMEIIHLQATMATHLSPKTLKTKSLLFPQSLWALLNLHMNSPILEA